MTKPTESQTGRAPNLNTLWARAFVEELARCGLGAVCISPGSRSTPLVVQLARHPDIEDVSIVDERSSAFFAVGAARALSAPVALVCTSGTAAANYLPAVCEAARAEVPLLVLTADRPAELHDCGASQAMDQTKLYGDHVRWFHQVAPPEATESKLRYVRSLACRAVARASGPTAGPVHLNFPFQKPLEPVEVPGDHPHAVPAALHDDAGLGVVGRKDGKPFVDISRSARRPDSGDIDRFVDRLTSAKRPLFFAGADHRGTDYADALIELASRLGAPIFAEPTSGLRAGKETAPEVLTCGDFFFAGGAYGDHPRPDLIVRTGRTPLLWSTRDFVREATDVDQIAVSARREFDDPDHVVCAQFVCDEATLFEAASERLDAADVDDGWLAFHQGAEEATTAELRRALDSIDEMCAPKAWSRIAATLPDGAGLFVSNSMPVRNADTFVGRRDQNLKYYFNRGINGIDGIVSTGLGVAWARKRPCDGEESPTVIALGDVALRHDIGALLLAGELGIDATVVVIDNDGGGIFEYLPIADFGETHRRHFATEGRSPLDGKSRRGFGGVTVVEPTSWDEFDRDLEKSVSSPGLQIIRVATQRRRDVELRDSIRQRVAAHIDEALTQQDQ